MEWANAEVDGIAWLKQLHGELTELVPSRGDYSYTKTKRVILEWELDRVFMLIGQLKLIAEPRNAEMGFGFGMALYQGPPYPGLEPEPVLVLTNKHLGADKRFDDSWEAFSPYTHNKDNAARLELFGFDPPKDKRHYEY